MPLGFTDPLTLNFHALSVLQPWELPGGGEPGARPGGSRAGFGERRRRQVVRDKALPEVGWSAAAQIKLDGVAGASGRRTLKARLVDF